MTPIDCVMRCPALPEPTDGSFEAIRLWAFDAAQKYETCAKRHEDCATALEVKP